MLILGFLALSFLRDSVLEAVKSLLWLKVEQNLARKVQVPTPTILHWSCSCITFCSFIKLSFFEHVHQLSYRWHMERKTGELLRVLDRGSSSMENILDGLVFRLIPTLADVVVAVSYVSTTLSPWFGLILVVTSLLYVGKCVGEWKL